jgi:hypothetical protein
VDKLDLEAIADAIQVAYRNLEDIPELQGQAEESLVIAMKALDEATEILESIVEDFPHVH